MDDSPRAGSDYAQTSQSSAVVIPVTANDYDPEGGVSVVYVDGWTWMGATITNNGDGTVTYDPRQEQSGGGLGPGMPGRDEFYYRVSDATGHETWCDVHVYVYVTDDTADDWPWAVRDEVWVEEDEPVVIEVLANDMDAEGPVTLNWAGSTGSTLGTVQANQDGTVTWTPPYENWNGSDYFAYDTFVLSKAR